MTDSTGYNTTAAQAAAEVITSGGVTIHLCTSQVGYTDSATEVTSASDADTDVAESALSVTAAGGFSGTTTITNDNEIDFGSQDIGTLLEIVIQNQSSTDQFIVADEPNDPDLTGENVTIPADTTLYEFGNP